MIPDDLDAIERDLRDVYLAPGIADAFAKLRRDAERYRWLRDGGEAIVYFIDTGDDGTGIKEVEIPMNKLDAAIDAALKEGK